MKKVVCVIDNHIFLRYGKTYEVVSERGGKYKISRDYFESSFLDIAELYWWDETFFVSLEEFRKEQIEKILE